MEFALELLNTYYSMRELYKISLEKWSQGVIEQFFNEMINENDNSASSALHALFPSPVFLFLLLTLIVIIIYERMITYHLTAPKFRAKYKSSTCCQPGI